MPFICPVPQFIDMFAIAEIISLIVSSFSFIEIQLLYMET